MPEVIKSKEKKKPVTFYGSGRRKTSSARVFLKSGKGRFTVNKREMVKDYFTKPEQVHVVLSPLKVLNLEKSFDVFSTVKGGGITGQAEALRHGLARALLKADESHRAVLKAKGFLTRDSRMVERKKYGRHKARKSTQFSKR